MSAEPQPLRLATAETPAGEQTIEQTVERLRDRPDVPPGPLLTTDEVAELCRVSRRCVERWDARGAVPGKVRLPGRLIRWNRQTVLDWIAAGCPAPARMRKAR